MPTKKGAGGRQQNYDPRTGRFVKTDYTTLFLSEKLTRKEKAQRKEKLRRESLYNRAKKSRDPLIFDVYLAIEQELPGSVQAVNETKFDSFLGGPRELDIITKKCIIEVKSGKKPKGLKQFLGQKTYAESKNKKFFVFAPKILTMAKISHEKNGITIVKDFKLLIKAIKEHEK